MPRKEITKRIRVITVTNRVRKARFRFDTYRFFQIISEGSGASFTLTHVPCICLFLYLPEQYLLQQLICVPAKNLAFPLML